MAPDDLDPPRSVLESVPEELAREAGVLPVRRDQGMLVLAVHDPHDIDKLQKVQFILKQDILIIVFPRRQLLKAIERAYADAEPPDCTGYFRRGDGIQFHSQAHVAKDHVLAQVVRLINMVWHHRADEARIEPEDGLLLARVVAKGEVVDESSVARRYLSSIASTVRQLAGMTPDEQEGRVSGTSGGQRFACGVRIAETGEGPSVVLTFDDAERPVG